MAAHAASLISDGAGKSGKPCERLTAPCCCASRVISRMTDSVNRSALCDGATRDITRIVLRADLAQTARWPFAVNGALAFVGGLAAAALVLAIARGGAEGPTRLVLAGSATMLALSSLTILLMLLFEQETHGDVRVGRGLDRAVRHRQGGPGGARGAARRDRRSCSGRAASTCSRSATTPRPCSGSTSAAPASSPCCSPCCWRRSRSPSPVRSASSA